MDIWSWTPNLEEFNEGAVTKTLISDMGGKEKRIGVGEPRRTFELTYSTINEVTADLMYEFFIAHNGQTDAFLFMHPKPPHKVYSVRFDMADMSKKSFYFIVANVGIKLIEVL